ncbi:MAG: hypothetical protein DRQ51_06655 [Gammaproteobacteria bacterium]|nr:MAG: hypothetical protein DRQ51_06655 [Gammaproteobacteria bacterium]
MTHEYGQQQLLQQIDILPIDIKTQIVDKILTSINPIKSSVDDMWIQEVKKRKSQIEIGDIKLVDGVQVFKKISQRLKA